MPLPRFTLGRLLAWIGFAAVDLWVLGMVYRKLGLSEGWNWFVFLGVAAWLAVLNLVAAVAHSQFRGLRVDRRDPEHDRQPDLLDRCLGLAVAVVFLAILAFPLILALGALTVFG